MSICWKIALMAFALLLSFDAAYSEPQLQWPLANPRITQDFGITKFVKMNPGFYQYGEHLAVDIADTFKAPVFAAANGVIIAGGNRPCPNFSKPECNFGYGNWLLIWHEELNIATSYLHLFETSSRKIGERVKAGDIIGKQGASGKIIGSHLHFAVFEGSIDVYTTYDGQLDFQITGRDKVKNPMTLLPPRK